MAYKISRQLRGNQIKLLKSTQARDSPPMPKGATAPCSPVDPKSLLSSTLCCLDSLYLSDITMLGESKLRCSTTGLWKYSELNADISIVTDEKSTIQTLLLLLFLKEDMYNSCVCKMCIHNPYVKYKQPYHHIFKYFICKC